LVCSALRGLPIPIETIGFDDPNHLTWSARSVGIERGCHCGEVFHNGSKVAELRLSVAGRHNLFNATSSLAACFACDISPAHAAAAINQFRGADRRMTEVGRYHGAIVT